MSPHTVKCSQCSMLAVMRGNFEGTIHNNGAAKEQCTSRNSRALTEKQISWQARVHSQLYRHSSSSTKSFGGCTGWSSLLKQGDEEVSFKGVQ